MTGIGSLGPRGWAVRLAFTALAAAVTVAIWVQDRTDALPLGLFNEGRDLFDGLSWAAWVVATGILLIFLVELLRGRPLRLAHGLRAVLASLLFFELLLFGIDVTLASRGDDPPLGGPYREFRGRDGGWIFVKKPHAASALGFRREHEKDRFPDAPRVLFLGDSYTEGSGRDLACNYPEVATATLAERLGRPVQVVNAGVAGYGPQDALRLFGHLLAEGESVDAVVLSLFLENDFTDNLPGTTRRVVAGINFRFPDSIFLHIFHPLNSRSFRYAIFVDRARRLVRGSGAGARRAKGECRLTPDAEPGPVPDELEQLVRRRTEALYGPSPRLAVESVTRALTALRDRAGSAGIPAFLAVFPDRLSSDPDLAAALALDLGALPVDRLWTPLRATWPDLIDMREALQDGSENYRARDTHLSDLGNLRAGRAAGLALSIRLREEDAFAPPH